MDNPHITVYFFLGTGLLIFAWAVVSFIKRKKELEVASFTSGVVIRLVDKPSSSGSAAPLLHPIVKFNASDGQEIEFVSSSGSRPARHKVGQSVRVRHPANAPQEADIDDTFTRWLGPAILLLIGGSFIGLSSLFLIVDKLFSMMGFAN